MSLSGLCHAGIYGGAAGITDVQRFLYPGQTPTRRVGSQSYLRDSSTTGDYRPPRLGRALVFNGTNEYASKSGLVLGQSATSVFAQAWVKTTSSGTNDIVNEYLSSGWYFRVHATKLQFYRTGSSGTGGKFSTTVLNDGNWHHVAVYWSEATDVLFWVDGVSDSATGAGGSGSLTSNANAIYVGGVSNYFNGSLRSVSVSNVRPSDAEIAVMANWRTAGQIPNQLAGWLCEEESGSTLYDWTGNGHNLTITGTTAVMHAADSDVKYSRANEVGYRASGAVIIPRDESDTANAADGSPLTYTGRVPYDAPLGGLPCVTFNGTDEKASAVGRVTSGSLTALTVAAWVNTSSTGLNTVAAEYYSAGNQRSWVTTVESGKFKVYLSDDGLAVKKQYVSTESINDGAWHHVAFVYDEGTLTMYIDDSAIAPTKTTDSACPSLYDTTKEFGIGFLDGGSLYWDGSLADVRIHSAALSASEITTIYEGGHVSTGHVETYPCTERNGPTIHGVNGNHLTIASSSLATVWSASCEHNDWLVRHGGRCRGVRFNGTDEYATAGGRVTTSNTALTIAAWVKRGSSAAMDTILAEYVLSGGNRRFRMDCSPTTLQFVASADGATPYTVQSNSGAVVQEVWTHVAVVYDAGSVKFYSNGVLDKSTTITPTTLYDVSLATKLGAYDTSSTSFEGGLADVRIHSAALSDADITTIYNGGHVATGHVETFPCNDSGGSKIIGNNGTELTITSSDVTQVWLPRIPGHPTNGLAADGGALTFGPGELPDDGTFTNRKPANYPRLLLVEDDYAALNTSEEVGDATTDPNNATDDGTTRHTLRTPA